MIAEQLGNLDLAPEDKLVIIGYSKGVTDTTDGAVRDGVACE